MSKHQEIIRYLEQLPIGNRVSVRGISNRLNVSDGTAYRAIKEAENRGLVETRPRSGTVRIKQKQVSIEKMTYQEIAEVTESQVLAGQKGLNREFSRFAIGAMTEKNVTRYLVDGGMMIVGDRKEIQLLALLHHNAVLITGGFEVDGEVLKLADKLGIPVLRSREDTYTVATTITRALSIIQIKTDIVTVEKVYRPSYDYGFLRETDTVKDYLDLVKKKHVSRFPVINQHQMVVGVVTMRDASGRSNDTILDKVMSRSVFVTQLGVSIANISQRMISEDFEMIPVVKGNRGLIGVVTRRDIMDAINQNQASNQPTFSDQIVHKLDKYSEQFQFVVEPFMLERNGVLSNGVITEVLTNVTNKLLAEYRKNIIIEQLSIYFLQTAQLDDLLVIEPKIVQQTRRSAIVDYEIHLNKQIVMKATITVKIN
ncbi:Cytosolic protein containing multiple CBS domain [Streptococcus sp. DD10]|uniref:CBS-HotDog domain-containing transcription factor SpxR n=1 Tax=Streptococcus sp. DD10 TaxID=1777878 RepID=UPI000796FCDE|nr:CBS-HotDog domain-containing transcription factor SpxR [Streptococcus sp. DD10]KXT76492.1 Cytosolic protein containing multiple CBS domain [Streptococcus sp. DD10]